MLDDSVSRVNRAPESSPITTSAIVWTIEPHSSVRRTYGSSHPTR